MRAGAASVVSADGLASQRRTDRHNPLHPARRHNRRASPLQAASRSSAASPAVVRPFHAPRSRWRKRQVSPNSVVRLQTGPGSAAMGCNAPAIGANVRRNAAWPSPAQKSCGRWEPISCSDTSTCRQLGCIPPRRDRRATWLPPYRPPCRA